MKRRRRRKPIPHGRWITVRGRPVLVPEMPAWARRAARSVMRLTGETDAEFRARMTFTNVPAAQPPVDMQTIARAQAALVAALAPELGQMWAEIAVGVRPFSSIDPRLCVRVDPNALP